MRAKLRWRIGLSALVALLAGGAVAAAVRAADPTPAEQQYEQLKNAEQHSDKLLAERWHKLVRQRQWVDSTGKHKTFARYLDHDPNYQWVKLLVLVKPGDPPTYKEGQVPMARLSKADQALVKRIASVRPQVEQALAAAPAGGYVDGEALAGEGPLRGEEAVMRAELPSPEAAAAPPPAALPYPTPAAEPWRTDFAAFAANFSATQGEAGPSLAWGELQALKEVHDQERMLASLAKVPADQQPPAAVRFQLGFAYGWARSGLGEVAWTATFDGAASADATATELKHDLQLPPPVTLVLVSDPRYPGDPSRFATGQPVQFIARFAELGGHADPPVLKLYVRLPTDERKSQPVQAPVATPASTTAARSAPAVASAPAAPVDHAALIAELEALEDEGPPPKLAAKLEQAAATFGRSAVDEFAASAQVTLTPDEEMPYLLKFEVAENAVAPLVEKHQRALLAKGWYLFRMQRHFDLDRGDQMALLPTTDKYEVLATVGTNGANSEIYTADVIKWLKLMEQQNPFVLTDAGFDSLAGRFTRPVADPDGLARRMYEFCPEAVEEVDEEAIAVLVARFKQPKAELYLWWD